MSLVKLLSGNKSRIVKLVTFTEPKLSKQGKQVFPMGLIKISRRTGIIGADYDNVKNKRLTSKGLPPENTAPLWGGKGEHVNKYFVKHTDSGEYYLKFLPGNFSRCRYIDKKTGEEVDKATVEKYTPNRSGGVAWNVISLDNIISLESGEIKYKK